MKEIEDGVNSPEGSVKVDRIEEDRERLLKSEKNKKNKK